MNTSVTAAAQWEEQQRITTARTDLAGRECLKHFVLVFALIALTLAVATMLARMAGDGSAQL